MTREENMAPIRNTSLVQEIWLSSELLFSNRLSWLLVLGPIALVGDSTNALGEASCFALSGIALIPCAERLSFVTEQVAEHTNGTIGALLNATFGNAPELLIATAALRSGRYRVVQLAMLGSMLTNLLFVFGLSCLVGGLRWQVQELRITSGNVSVGMLFLSVAGSLLPAALVLSGQLRQETERDPTDDNPSPEELTLCRFNAFILVFMYVCYLSFQLGTHKEEFDEEENVVESADGHQLYMTPLYKSRGHGHGKSKRNIFCLNFIRRLGGSRSVYPLSPSNETGGDVELSFRGLVQNDHMEARELLSGGDDSDRVANRANSSDLDSSDGSEGSGLNLLPQNEAAAKTSNYANGYFDEYNELASKNSETDSSRRRTANMNGGHRPSPKLHHRKESQQPGRLIPLGLADPDEDATPPPKPPPLMSFRVGVIWLFVITLCISAMSDILVDTIDGFAVRSHLSGVFTSMVIVPFFSNVAEQVSAVLFAYRNEMDLCVGVTVGSAIQVMTFVLPGCVLIGGIVDRGLSLYFQAYETACLFLGVVTVAAVLQGGTTNWLVGVTLMSVYFMMAAGFWFHVEESSIDGDG